MKRILSATALLATFAVGGLALSSYAVASTADGSTPSTETVCDTETGVAFGLCVAYCEATDCDTDSTLASDEACTTLADNFVDLTGSDIECFSDDHGTPACDQRCYETAEQKFSTCFNKEVIRKDFVTGPNSFGEYSYTTLGSKVEKDAPFKKHKSERFIKDNDCGSRTKLWLSSCLSKCD